MKRCGLAPIRHYLSEVQDNQVELKFSEIERIIKNKLPQKAVDEESALNWWDNSIFNYRARYWLEVGFETTEKSTTIKYNGSIRFRRINPEKSGAILRKHTGAIAATVKIFCYLISAMIIPVGIAIVSDYSNTMNAVATLRKEFFETITTKQSISTNNNEYSIYLDKLQNLSTQINAVMPPLTRFQQYRTLGELELDYFIIHSEIMDAYNSPLLKEQLSLLEQSYSRGISYFHKTKERFPQTRFSYYLSAIYSAQYILLRDEHYFNKAESIIKIIVNNDESTQEELIVFLIKSQKALCYALLGDLYAAKYIFSYSEHEMESWMEAESFYIISQLHYLHAELIANQNIDAILASSTLKQYKTPLLRVQISNTIKCLVANLELTTYKIAKSPELVQFSDVTSTKNRLLELIDLAKRAELRERLPDIYLSLAKSLGVMYLSSDAKSIEMLKAYEKYLLLYCQTASGNVDFSSLSPNDLISSFYIYNSLDRIEENIDKGHELLKRITYADAPILWAYYQMDLGKLYFQALLNNSQSEDGTSYAENALKHLYLALDEFKSNMGYSVLTNEISNIVSQVCSFSEPE